MFYKGLLNYFRMGNRSEKTHEPMGHQQAINGSRTAAACQGSSEKVAPEVTPAVHSTWHEGSGVKIVEGRTCSRCKDLQGYRGRQRRCPTGVEWVEQESNTDPPPRIGIPSYNKPSNIKQYWDKKPAISNNDGVTTPRVSVTHQNWCHYVATGTCLGSIGAHHPTAICLTLFGLGSVMERSNPSAWHSKSPIRRIFFAVSLPQSYSSLSY